MPFWIVLAGLGVSFLGALVTTLAEARLTRSILIYLDAVEGNVREIVDAIRSGATALVVTSPDLKRDRGQERLRALKIIGWLTVALGFGTQLVGIWLSRPQS